MPLLRLVTAMAATDAAMVATAVAAMAAMAVTARGRLRLMPLLRLDTAAATVAMVVMAAAMAAMVAAAMVATVTAVAMATGVSYHRRRRSELSQIQNHTKIVIVEAVKT